MKRFAVTLAVLLVCHGTAFSMGGDHRKGKLGKVHADWSDGLLEMINFDARVHGHWVNANDEFFYQADTAVLNRFLAQCSKLKGTPSKVILHAGSARRSDLWGKKPEMAYDWKLLIMRRGWGAPEDVPRPKDDSGYVVTVDVWLDGKVELEKLEVPANIAVESGGEIREFIRQHKSRKNDADNATEPADQPSITIRGTSGKFKGWYVDYDEQRESEEIGGAISSRNPLLTENVVPGAHWRLIETDRGFLIQSQGGDYQGWYLDFDDDGTVEDINGDTAIARNLLLSEERVPGAFWKLTKTDKGCLIQAQAERFVGWYLSIDNSFEDEEIGGARSSRCLLLTKELVPGAFWRIDRAGNGRRDASGLPLLRADPVPGLTPQEEGVPAESMPKGWKQEDLQPHYAASEAAKKEVPFDKWLRQCFTEASSIKLGMTRQEVGQRLRLDGGLQGFASVRYVHPDCPSLKVRVGFAVKRNPNDQNRVVAGKDDKVVSTSAPYVEQPYCD